MLRNIIFIVIDNITLRSKWYLHLADCLNILNLNRTGKIDIPDCLAFYLNQVLAITYNQLHIKKD